MTHVMMDGPEETPTKGVETRVVHHNFYQIYRRRMKAKISRRAFAYMVAALTVLALNAKLWPFLSRKLNSENGVDETSSNTHYAAVQPNDKKMNFEEMMRRKSLDGDQAMHLSKLSNNEEANFEEMMMMKSLDDDQAMHLAKLSNNEEANFEEMMMMKSLDDDQAMHLSKLSNNEEANFEEMRRKALDDGKAIYLSKQVTPPFDPQFKNPCWWYGGNNNNQSLACLPYFYLAGFPKSGTTDLYCRLTHHPLISKRRSKGYQYLREVQFGGSRPPCGIGGINRYEGRTSCDILRYAHRINHNLTTITTLKSDTIDWSVFQGNTESKKLFKHPAISVDASTSTGWDVTNGWHIVRDIPLPHTILQSNASVIDWIVKMNPNVRVLFIMREPVSRIYSGYNYFKKHESSHSPEHFDKLVGAFLEDYHRCRKSGTSPLACAWAPETNRTARVHIGLYHLYLEEWLVRIPRKQIHVVRLEDYSKNMTQSLQGIFEFLGLPRLNEKQMRDIVSIKLRNVLRKKEPMLPTTRKTLMEFYRPFNEKLAELLDNDAFLWQDVYSKYESES